MPAVMPPPSMLSGGDIFLVLTAARLPVCVIPFSVGGLVIGCLLRSMCAVPPMWSIDCPEMLAVCVGGSRVLVGDVVNRLRCGAALGYTPRW